LKIAFIRRKVNQKRCYYFIIFPVDLFKNTIKKDTSQRKMVFIIRSVEEI